MRTGGIAVVAILLTTLLAAGVGTVPSEAEPGRLDITTDKCSYAEGENVAVHFSNVGNTSIGWGEMGAQSMVPYQIFDERGDLAWANNVTMDYPPELGPGETYTHLWNQTYGGYENPRHGQVDPGAYRITSTASVLGPPGDPTTDTEWIWIGEPCGRGLGVLDVTTDRCSYAVGELVGITFANVGGTTIWWGEQGFPDRIPYEVFDEQGNEVWGILAKPDTPHGLDPGQTYSNYWNQTYRTGFRRGQVDPGAYRITSTASVQGSPPGTATEDSQWIWIGVPCAGSGPVADAGPDQTIPEGAAIRLDGSGSQGSTLRSGGGLPRIDNYSCPWTQGNSRWPSDPIGPFDDRVRNGGFEQGLDDWRSVGSVSVSGDGVHGGSSSLLVNTTSSTAGYVEQRIDPLGQEYVLYAWVRTASTGSDPMVLELISNEYLTGYWDVAVRLELYSDRIVETMWGLRFLTVYPNHLAEPGWHRLVLAQNASAKAACVWIDDTSSWSSVRYDVRPFPPELLRVGDVSANGSAGEIYFDDLILVGSTQGDATEANITSYRWDLDDRIDSDGDGNLTDDADATGPVVNATYGDDGTYVVTLTVTDSVNDTATDTAMVTVVNVDPRILGVYITPGTAGDLGLRVAGRKWNAVNLTLYADGNAAGTVGVKRMPGSPDEQIAWIPGPFNLSTDYVAVVTYEPQDLGGRELGANPVWLVAGVAGNFTVIAHHTFNVVRSEVGNSSHWNHIDPWTVNLTGRLASSRMVITVDAVDDGSDDLTFTWGGVVHTTFNDGLGPDPVNSPWGTFPFIATDRLEIDYIPGMTIDLTVTDDDGGATTVVLSP